ncbi:MAG TPA: hypothetical protein VFH25_01420 [Nitrososphaeraceae archaeon]|nr:hypothetical protein [Nitrososphaeraceae archaeon]
MIKYPLVFSSVTIIIAYMFLLFVLNSLPVASAQAGTTQQPNINATNLYETGQMILPSNVKHRS